MSQKCLAFRVTCVCVCAHARAFMCGDFDMTTGCVRSGQVEIDHCSGAT